MNLSVLPDRRAAENPAALAVSDDVSELTNAEFLSLVQRGSAALAAHGVQAGDAVALKLPNTASFIVALFAAWRLGAAVTPINPSLSPPEVGYQLADAAAKVLIADKVSDAEQSLAVLTTEMLSQGDPASHEDTVATDSSALALLIYTSGTTGRPKGVMLDHGNLEAMCRSVIDAFSMTSDDRSLLILPLFHVNGIVIGTLCPLIAGGSATVAGRFELATFFPRIEQSRATYFSAVPTIYTMLCGLPEDPRPDTSSLRFAICGAAPASAELLDRFETRFQIPVIEGYGLSEGTCASTVNPLHGERKPGTVGLALPGQTIGLIDPAGNPAADGEAGEVVIKGPNVMRGYLNKPDETAKTVVDGWLHTGDLGRFDEDGYLVLVGREKDMIIRGGENIYPREIEVVVHELPEIAEAAVVGRPDKVYGEQPVLYVSTHPGATVDVDSIRNHIAGNLSKYKWPVNISILDDLPKNPVGKIDKPALRRLSSPPAAPEHAHTTATPKEN
jgi:long-chain acyl-CoA synthetase